MILEHGFCACIKAFLFSFRSDSQNPSVHMSSRKSHFICSGVVGVHEDDFGHERVFFFPVFFP